MEQTETSKQNNGTNRYMSNKSQAAPTALSTTTIEDLYKYFGILADAKDKAGEYPETFIQIVSGTKGGPREKQLASQFITRFFKYFSKEMPLALESVFDLCEDEDVNVMRLFITDCSRVLFIENNFFLKKNTDQKSCYQGSGYDQQGLRC